MNINSSCCFLVSIDVSHPAETGEQTQNSWCCSSLVPDRRQAKADGDSVSPSRHPIFRIYAQYGERSGFIKCALSRIQADALPGRGGEVLLASAVTQQIR